MSSTSTTYTFTVLVQFFRDMFHLKMVSVSLK